MIRTLLDKFWRKYNLRMHAHEYFRGYVWAYTKSHLFVRGEEDAVYVRIVEAGHCDHATTLCTEEKCVEAAIRTYLWIDWKSTKAGMRFVKLLMNQPWWKSTGVIAASIASDLEAAP